MSGIGSRLALLFAVAGGEDDPNDGPDKDDDCNRLDRIAWLGTLQPPPRDCDDGDNHQRDSELRKGLIHSWEHDRRDCGQSSRG